VLLLFVVAYVVVYYRDVTMMRYQFFSLAEVVEKLTEIIIIHFFTFYLPLTEVLLPSEISWTNSINLYSILSLVRLS